MAELKLIGTGLLGLIRDIPRMLAATGPRVWTFWLVYIVTGLLLLALLNTVPRIIHAERGARSKQNLYAVQLALERFATDSPGGDYPVRIEQIIEDGYLGEMPLNPFTGQPMRWVVYGSYDYARSNPDGLSHGDFGYITRTDRGRRSDRSDQPELNSRDVTSYTLVLY